MRERVRACGAAALMIGLTGVPAAAAEIDAKAGESLARRQCAACHTVGPTRARERPPTFSDLAQDLATTRESLEFLLTQPHDTMPNLKLGADELAEIIAYIMSLRRPAR